MKILAILAAVAVTAGAGEWPLYSQWRNDWATQTIYMTDGFVAAVEIEYPGADLVISNGAQTVTVVTNTVAQGNAEPCPICGSLFTRAQEIVTQAPTIHFCKATAETERTFTTTVKEVRTLLVWYGGEPFTIRRERVISENVRRQVLLEA